MGMLKDFKEFAVKGNVVDLAVAVIIGAAFGKIVASLVNDIIMPPIGLLMGGVDFKELKVILREAVGANPAVTWNYGNFIQTLIDFLIIAFCIFMLVKGLQKAQKKKVEAPVKPAEPSEEEKLLTEIRDLLKK